MLWLSLWIFSFYRNEKKINALFCIKVHFSIINLCKQRVLWETKTKALLFCCSGFGTRILLFKSRLTLRRPCQMPKFWMAKKFSIFQGTSITFFGAFCTQIFLHNILRVTLVSTALVKLLLLAKHLSLLSVWTLLRRLIVRSFFTTPSNVCWYVSSSNLSSMYQITLGRGSPAKKKSRKKFKGFFFPFLGQPYKKVMQVFDPPFCSRPKKEK